MPRTRRPTTALTLVLVTLAVAPRAARADDVFSAPPAAPPAAPPVTAPPVTAPPVTAPPVTAPPAPHPPAPAPPPAEPVDPPPPGAIPWTEVPPAECRLVERVLASRHWPQRVLGLLRLERYRGPGLAPLVRERLADDAWQVRCFALRAAWRLEIPVDPATTAEEDDGRVIRAALTFGVAFDEARLEKHTRRLMRSKDDDRVILGLEIAAASEVQSLRREATRITRRIFENLDATSFPRIARRLARIVGLPVEKADSVEAWREWYAAQDGRIDLAAGGASAPRAGPDDLPLVAAIDAVRFSRLLDYLDVLKERDLDVAIVMDATASMLPMINEARAGVESLILFLDDLAREMRLALVAYRDHDNEPVWEGEAFTRDVGRIRDFLYRIRITGGWTLPEAVLDGLTACGRLRWSREAVRQIVLVGDARPHDEDMYRISSLLDSFRSQDVLVHAVHVPMRLHPLHYRLPPEHREYREAEITDHNALTAKAFGQIAEWGGGETVMLARAADLVPAIMHLSIDPAWRDAFDEFYTLYMDLCR